MWSRKGKNLLNVWLSLSSSSLSWGHSNRKWEISNNHPPQQHYLLSTNVALHPTYEELVPSRDEIKESSEWDRRRPWASIWKKWMKNLFVPDSVDKNARAKAAWLCTFLSDNLHEWVWSAWHWQTDSDSPCWHLIWVLPTANREHFSISFCQNCWVLL